MMGFHSLKIKVIFLFVVIFPLISLLNLFSQTIKLEPLRDRWALLIGISKYRENRLSLNYAHNDALSLYDSLLSTCRFDKNNIRLLINQDATRENIRKSIEGWLYQNTKKDDNILIYFSGHGTQDIDNNNDEDDGYDEFLVPYDFDSNDMSSAIRDDFFAYLINSLASENIVLIFDSCYSGGAAKEKGFNHVVTRGDIQVDSFIQDIFKKDKIGEIPKEGVALLGASQDNQVSYEEQEFSKGVFTHYLIDSLSAVSDEDQDSTLTIEEIFNNLQPKVSNYSRSKYKKEQNPVFINALASPFKLAYLPIETTKDKIDEQKIQYMLLHAIRTTNNNRAISQLIEICELAPENSTAHKLLAMHYFNIGKYEEALYHYEICSTLFKSYRTYLDIAKTHERLGSKQNAILYASKALELEKDNSEILNYFGNLHLKSSEYENALSYFKKSISINNLQAVAYIGLARSYICLKDYERAITALKKGLEINPDDPSHKYLYALLHKYNYLKDNPYLSDQYYGLDIRNADFWKLIDMLSVDDSSTVSIYNSSKERIDDFTETIEPYIIMINYYLKIKKNKEMAIGFYNNLISLYPFLEDDKKITSILK